jgi:hypothetical protein
MMVYFRLEKPYCRSSGYNRLCLGELAMNDEFSGIVQMCYVTRNLDEAIDKWIAMYRAGPFYVGEFQVPGQNYRGTPITTHVRVGVSFCGPLNIELLQPMGDGPSVFHEGLEQRGEGLHHFWKMSDDYDSEIARHETLGHSVVAGGRWPGVGRTAFVDTRAVLGAYTEVLESSDLLFATLSRIRDAHRTWDGTRPVRPYSDLA